MMVPPPDLVDAVRAAAAAVPGHGGDLAAVRRRGLTRVRRRRAATAGVAAVVLGAGAVPLAHATGTGAGRLGPVPPAPAASQPLAPAAIAQRLLISGSGAILQQDGRPTVGISSRDGIGEVLADGRVTWHPMSAVDGTYNVVPRPDGSMVVLGYVDHMPGVERDDGVWIPGVSFDLVVLSPRGIVMLRRDVRVMGEHVALAAATDEIAYLVRPGELVAHDLSTGLERRVLGLPDDDLALAADVAAGRAVLVRANSNCTARIYDLARQVEISHVTPGVRTKCKAPPTVRLSPDGRLAAVSYLGVTGPDDDVFTHRVGVFDVATGQLRGEQVIEEQSMRFVRAVGMTPLGFAWSDHYTLRTAFAVLPDRPTRVYRIEELLRIETLRVGG